MTVYCDVCVQESDWNVLQCLLEKLPSLLQNKTLVLASFPRDVEKICIRLCKLVCEHVGFLSDKMHLDGKLSQTG